MIDTSLLGKLMSEKTLSGKPTFFDLFLYGWFSFRNGPFLLEGMAQKWMTALRFAI